MDDERTACDARARRTLTAAAAVLGLAAAARAEPKAVASEHVPAAVADGTASLVGPMPADQQLRLAISLPLRDEASLRQLLKEIQDPSSPSYRHYLSVKEFTERFGPSASDYAAMIKFAQKNYLRVTKTSVNRRLIIVEAPVSRVEQALHVKMNLYRHPAENRTFRAPDREPTLDLDVPVLHVSGLDDFVLHRPKHGVGAKGGSGQSTGSGSQGNFQGSDLRAAYYGGTLDGQGQSVALFEEGGYEIKDVKLYFTTVNQPLNVPVKGVSADGAKLDCKRPDCTDDSEEALDIETAISMAPALKQVVVYVGYNGDDVPIFNRIAEDDTSLQISCSWGWGDDESALDPIFLEFQAQGQTLFVATGDDGSATPGWSVWPADDPLVTAVGGTDLVTAGPGGPWQSETAWPGSAGGYSLNGVPIPSYQTQPGVITASNQGSRTLRNYPDVSAEANNLFSCYDDACWVQNYGTSYAAPQWAGIAALLNQQGQAQHQPPLGFFNPEIYALGLSLEYSQTFHDIVSGSNGQFAAVPGYDLVTGWGTPIVPGLLLDAYSAPPPICPDGKCPAPNNGGTCDAQWTAEGCQRPCPDGKPKILDLKTCTCGCPEPTSGH